MNSLKPCIILIDPQMGENIGAAARAMLNFGLTDLRLVHPRDGWPNQNALSLSAGAFDLMPEPQLFDSVEAAIGNLNVTYATTARRRDMVKPVFTPTGAMADAATRATQDQKIGFIFGPERSGLTNEHLTHCTATITIPTNPDFSSLNLGQSVLLIAHEWYKTQDKTADRTIDSGLSFPVEQEKLNEFFVRLESELSDANFFQDAKLKPTMVRNIRNIFSRNDMTDQEVRTFHGIVSALLGKKRQ